VVFFGKHYKVFMHTKKAMVRTRTLDRKSERERKRVRELGVLLLFKIERDRKKEREREERKKEREMGCPINPRISVASQIKLLLFKRKRERKMLILPPFPSLSFFLENQENPRETEREREG
jgi:dihydroorotase-like cyclic amidohydrolase